MLRVTDILSIIALIISIIGIVINFLYVMKQLRRTRPEIHICKVEFKSFGEPIVIDKTIYYPRTFKIVIHNSGTKRTLVEIFPSFKFLDRGFGDNAVYLVDESCSSIQRLIEVNGYYQFNVTMRKIPHYNIYATGTLILELQYMDEKDGIIVCMEYFQGLCIEDSIWKKIKREVFKTKIGDNYQMEFEERT